MSFGKFAIGVSIGAALAPAFTSTIASSKEKIKGLKDTVEKLEAKRLAAVDVKKYQARLTALEQRARSTGVAGKGLRKEIIAAKEAFKAATVKARGLGVATGNIAREEHRLETALRRTNKALQARKTMRQQRRFRREQAGGVLEAAAPVVAMAAPVVVAAKFEQGMAEVGAVANASDKEMVQLTATARSLGATTSFSASEAAQGMKYLAMAGFKTTETIAAMPGVLALARAGNTDLARTADISSDMLSAFRLEADKMGMVGDVLTKTFTTSNVNLELLGETMKYVAPVATSAGMSIQEVAAMTGLLGDVGIKGSQAGTALRASILRLADPPREAAEALKELGVSTVDSKGNLKKMPELLAEVAEAMKGMGSGERLSYVSQIFGMEASSAMDTLLEKTTGGEIRKKITLVTDSEGTTKEIAAKMEATTMGAVRRLRSAVESLGISFGSLALPVVNTLAGGLTGLAGGIDRIATKFPRLAAGAFGLAAGFAAIPPVMLAMRIGASYLATAKAGLTLIVSGLGRAFAWTQGQMVAHNVAQKTVAAGAKLAAAGQWLWNRSLAAGSFVLAKGQVLALGAAQKVVAVGAKLAAAGQWLWNRSLAAGSFVLAKGRVLALGAAQKVVAVGAKLAAAGQWLWNRSLAAGSFVLAKGRVLALGAAQKVVAVGTKVLGAAQIALGAAMNVALGPIGLVIGAVAALAAGAYMVYKHWDTVKVFMGTVWTSLKNGANFAWEGLKKIFAWSPLGLVVQGFTAVKNFLGNIDLSASGKALIGTFVSGIKSMIAAPIEAVQGVLAKVREFLPFSDAKTGPLSSLTASGAAFVTTFTAGIKSMATAPIKAVQGIFSKVASWFGDDAAPETGAVAGSVQPVTPHHKQHSQAEALSPLPKLDTAFVTTFTAGIKSMAAAPIKAVQGIFSRVASWFGDDAAPEMRTIVRPAQPGILQPAVRMQAAPAEEQTVASNAAATFQKTQGRGIIFNQNITVNGSSRPEEVKTQVSEALGISEQRLRRMIEEVMHNDRRLSYA